MSAKIHYFGAGGRLLGVFHAPTRLQPRSTAVLLCSPFGEESARAHRMLRVLATQLERAGYCALRFDYGGTGDSQGDGAGASLEGWISDLGEAAAHLQRLSRVNRLTVVGVRLGATLAMRAAAEGLRMRHLIMWDPVIHGPSYLSELAAQHRAYLREELGGMYRDRLKVNSDGAPSEALGAPIGDALARGLAGVDLAATPAAADLFSVLTSRTSAETARLRAHLPAQTRWTELSGTANWNSDAALNAMVVPAEIVGAIVARVEEVSA